MSKLIKVPTSKLTESEWQDLRQTFVDKGMVGGSDAGTLLGLNKYKSPINLFYQAVGLSRLPNKMNHIMLHGKQLEEYVANCWQYFDGTSEGWVDNTLNSKKIKTYRKVRAIVLNPKYPALFANIDGQITSHPVYGKKKGILEIKTISGYSADSYEAGIPPSYLAQIQQYMLVMGYEYGEICYLKDGRELGVVTFEADPELQERILVEANNFQRRVYQAKKVIEEYKAHNPYADDNELYGVISDLEPDADDSQAFNEFISEKHKARANEGIMQGTDEHQEWAVMAANLSDEIKEKEEEKRLYQNRLKQLMEHNNAAVLKLPDGKVTWRKQFLITLNK
jgi:putative phage-type endonuclease